MVPKFQLCYRRSFSLPHRWLVVLAVVCAQMNEHATQKWQSCMTHQQAVHLNRSTQFSNSHFNEKPQTNSSSSSHVAMAMHRHRQKTQLLLLLLLLLVSVCMLFLLSVFFLFCSVALCFALFSEPMLEMLFACFTNITWKYPFRKKISMDIECSVSVTFLSISKTELNQLHFPRLNHAEQDKAIVFICEISRLEN